MKYDELLKTHEMFGSTKEDIAAACEVSDVLENVVIAPWWEHKYFENIGFVAEQKSSRVYTLTKDNLSFSFIEMKAIGSSAIMDYVLALGVTKCKNLIFIGSAGALDEKIKIGDVVIPSYSICGDGASRYLNKNFEDEFGIKEYPNLSMNNEIIEILKEKNITYHNVPNFSVDNVFCEFNHIDQFIDYGAKTVEMETANVFKCCELMGIKVAAIFGISDNITLKKSLFSGRSDEEKARKDYCKKQLIPEIVSEYFKRHK